MHKPLKFSIWFPVVIAAVFVVAWLWIRESSEPGPYDLEPVNIVRNGSKSGSTTNDIAGWQTYRNEKYGFEVKYPLDLVKISDFGKEGLYKGFDFSGDTKVGDNELCLQSSDVRNPRSHEGEPCTLSFAAEFLNGKSFFDWLVVKYSAQYFGTIQEYAKQMGGKFIPFTVNNIRWYFVSTEEGPGGSSALYTVNKDIVVISNVSNLVGVSENILTKEYPHQILSTFRFLE